MITVKLGELRGIVSCLHEIMEEKLPVKAAYSFGKLGHAIQKEFKIYEENRLKLIDRYCSRDEDGKPIIENGNYKIANTDEFGQGMTELANIEAEIKFDPINIDKLGDIQVSPAVMAGLDKFIVGD